MKLKRASCNSKSFEQSQLMPLLNELSERILTAESLITNVTNSYSLMLCQSDSEVQSLRLNVLQLEERLESSGQQNECSELTDDLSETHRKRSTMYYQAEKNIPMQQKIQRNQFEVTKLEDRMKLASVDHQEMFDPTDKKKTKKDLSADLLATRNQVSQLRAEICEINRRHDDRIKECKSECNQLKQNLTKKEQQIRAQQLQLSQNQISQASDLAKAHEENEELNQKLRTLKIKLKEEQDAALTRQKKWDLERNNLDGIVNDLQFKLQDTADELNSQLHANKQRTEEISSQLDHMKLEHKAEQDAILTTNANLKKLNEELADRLSTSNNKICQQNSELLAANEKIQMYNRELLEGYQYNCSLKSEICQLKEANEELQNKMVNIQVKEQEEFQKYKTETVPTHFTLALAKFDDEEEQIKVESPENRDGNVTEHQAQIHTVISDIDFQSIKSRQRESEISSTPLSLASSDLDLAISRNQQYEKELTSEQQSNFALQNEIALLRKQVDTVQDELSELHVLHEKDKEEFQKCLDDTIQKERFDSSEKLVRLSEKLQKEKELIIEDHETQIAQAYQEKSRLEEELVQAYSTTRDEVLQVKKEMDELLTKHESLTDKQKETLFKSKHLEETLVEKESQIKSLILQLSLAEDTGKSNSDELLEERNKNDTLSDTIVNLTSEIAALKIALKVEQDDNEKRQLQLVIENKQLNIVIEGLHTELDSKTNILSHELIQIEQKRVEVLKQLEKLKTECHRQQASIQVDINKLKDINDRLFQRLHSSESESTEKSTALNQKSSDLVLALAKNKAYEDELKMERHAGSAQQDEIASLRKHVNALQDEMTEIRIFHLKEKKELNETIQKEHAEASQMIANTLEELQKAENEKEHVIQSYESQLVLINLEKSKIEEDVTAANAKLMEEMDKLQKKYEILFDKQKRSLQKNKQLEENLIEKESQITQQISQLSEAEVKISEELHLEKCKNDELCDTIVNLNNELSALKRASTEKQNAQEKCQLELVSEIKQSNAIIEDLQSTLEAKTSELKSKMIEIEQERIAVSKQMERNSSKYQKQQDDLQAEILELKGINEELNKCFKSSESDNSFKVSQYARDLDTALAKAQEHEQKVTMERQLNSVLQKEVSSLKEQADMLQDELMENQILHLKEREEFQKIVKTLMKEHDDASQKVTEVENEKELIIQDCQLQIEESAKSKNDLMVKLTTSNDQLIKVKKQLHELQYEHDKHIQVFKGNELEHEKVLLKNDQSLQIAETQKEKLQKRVMTLNDELDALRMKYDSEQEIAANSQQHIKKENDFLKAKLEAETNEARYELSEATMKLKELQDELQATSHQLNCEKQFLHEEKEMCKQLESELTSMKNELDSKKRSQNFTESKCERLHKYIESLLKVIMDNQPDLLDRVQTSS